MILTVSPNPALDRVHVVRGFRPGEQSRALRAFLQAGGSGVHAAAVAQRLGGDTLALGLLGGATGEVWRRQAVAEGLAFDMVPIPGETRESFCLVDLDLGSQVEAVEPGPQVETGTLDRLLDRLRTYLPQAELLVLSGSLPPGFPADAYARMIGLAWEAGVRALVDAHSEPLRLALEGRPWLIKPNLAEFHDLVGRETTSPAERWEASRELAREYGLAVALSMAGEGMLLTTPEEQWRLLPPEVEMRLPGGTGRNSIGCGDALVGALAAEFCRSGDLLRAACRGMAAAHQNLETFGVPEVDPERVGELVGKVSVERREGHGIRFQEGTNGNKTDSEAVS
ncbi:MAG TPA: 1-phosphofructokinase family hexose kinase [Anaerolineaceae bacterium]|nr:1-phosphofructokinase family hexose kinase [Anaerolineaceae bacterium]